MLLHELTPEWLTKKRDMWESEFRKWWQRVELYEQYYYNDVDDTSTTFNKIQLEKIEENTGIPVSLNKIYSVVEQKLAILTQTKTSSKVVAFDTNIKSKQYAYLLDKCKNSIMYNSNAILEQKEAIKDMLVMGMGVVGIFPKLNPKVGDFRLEYVYMHPSDIRLDINSRKIHNGDMSGFFITKQIGEEEAKELFSEKIEMINLKYDKELKLRDFGQATYQMKKGKRGQVDEGYDLYKYDTLEYYTKEYTKMFFVPTPEGDIEFVFAENLEPGMEVILNNAIEVEQNKFVVKYTMLGNYLIEKEYLPITNFPIRVRYFNWGGKPYRSYGVIHYLKEMQDAQDKSVQLLVQNGMLTNNVGWEAPIGSIPETEKVKYEQQGNRPGIIKVYNPVVIEGQVLKPERTQIQALSNFYPMLIEMLDKAMEVSSGIHPFMSGDPKNKIDVFSTLQQYQNAGMQRILMSMLDIQVAEEYIGNILIEWLIANLDPDENYVIFDQESKDFNELQVAQELISELRQGRYKVLAIPSELTPTQKMSMATELMKISQTTPDPVERSVYIQKAFELSDMRAFDEVQEEIDIGKRLQQQLQQTEEEIKRLEEINKQLENRVINAEIRNKILQKYAEAMDNITTAEAETKKDITIEKLEEQIKDLKRPAKQEESKKST